MRRVLFQWRGITIHSYPAMLYVGIVLGVIIGTRAGALHGMPKGRLLASMLLLVAPALMGARLLYVATHWKVYRLRPGDICRKSDGGAGLYGGLIAAFV